MKKCKKCGVNVENEKSSVCPACGAKLGGGFPVWVIVVLVILGIFASVIIPVAVTIVMTMPTLMTNTDRARNKAMFLKTTSNLIQSLLMSNALDDKYYNNFDELWEKGVKGNLNIASNLENGIKLADLTEIKYEKLNNTCKEFPTEYNENTACAILTIDVNGFDNGDNKLSYVTEKGTQMIYDRFVLLLYPNTVAPYPKSLEDVLLNKQTSK